MEKAEAQGVHPTARAPLHPPRSRSGAGHAGFCRTKKINPKSYLHKENPGAEAVTILPRPYGPCGAASSQKSTFGLGEQRLRRALNAQAPLRPRQHCTRPPRVPSQHWRGQLCRPAHAGALGPLALSHPPLLTHIPSSFFHLTSTEMLLVSPPPLWFAAPPCWSGLRNRRQSLPRYVRREGREEEQFCSLLARSRTELSHPEFPQFPRMTSTTRLSQHLGSTAARELGHRGQGQPANRS